MGIDPSVFSQLWDATQDPYRALERRVALLERHMSRAEVAGAVERVETLPAPGQPGRLLSTQQNVFVDSGPVFVPVGKMLGFIYQVNTVGWNNAGSALTWSQLQEPENLYLDFTPSGDTAYVRAENTMHVGVTPPNSAAGYRTLFLDGVNLGDDTVGLGSIEPGPSYPVTGGAALIANYPTMARVTGLTPGQTYRLTVRVKSTNASYLVGTAANRSHCLMAWEA
jgi:hypothetical protein